MKALSSKIGTNEETKVEKKGRSQKGTHTNKNEVETQSRPKILE